MIITRTPFRVSFIGGGTDLPKIFKYYPGGVISTTIDRYMYISVKEKFDSKFLISYSKTELVDNLKDIKHPIAKEALRYFKINNSFEISSMADIPAKGTGLGSSSSYAVGLINAISSLKNINLSKFKIANLACYIEIQKLQDPVGKQDQFAAAYGGLRRYKFFPSGKVHQRKIDIDEKFLKRFEDSLLFFYIGNKKKVVMY